MVLNLNYSPLCPDSLRFRFFMPLHRRNSARDKVIGKKQIYKDRVLVRDASRQAKKLCPKDPVGHSVIIQGAWGLEKTASSFLGVVAPLSIW